ncbi:MAG: polysaccharide biosynthesis tyrosine autokinase [Armatimonadetes bacterium]|nr:polysaccharide biosynthesis tyrosine autokinase [Armatimonadota bacterium]
MEFWRYYRVIRRRRWLILLGTLAALIAVVFWNSSSEPLYTGRTTVMESKSIRQIGVPLYQSQLISSPTDLQLQISNLGNLATSNRVMQNAAMTLADLGLKYEPREVLAATSVTPVKDTNTLAIEVTLPSQEAAKVAADVVAAEFKKVYAELNNASVSQSREFIEAQIEATHAAMIRAQDALKKYKEESGVILIDQQSAAAISRISRAEETFSNTQIAHQTAAARAAQALKEVESLKEWENSGKTVSQNPIWQQLTVQLIDLETRKASMLNGGPGQSRRGPNHPEVLAVQAQIDNVKKELLNTKEEYIASSVESKNPIYQNATNAYVSARVEDIATAAQQQAAKNVSNEARLEMAQLPAKEAKMAELTLDLKTAADTYALMKVKLDEAKILEQQNQNDVALKTIDSAFVRPVDQKHGLKIILALMLAPLMGVGVAFLLHYTDNTVKTVNDAEKLLDLPVLTAVPGAKAHSLPRHNCPEIMDVAYQMLTSNLWIATQESENNSIVMVSAEPDAGRSVTASNLAVSLAREGARVILVDSDLRKPTQHLIFGVENRVGLTNILSGGATLEDALAPTRVQGLLLVPSGPVPDNPVKLLRSPEMKDFTQQISELADFVIYDTPAGIAFPDPVLVATLVGNAVVVHSAGRVPRGSEAELRARLDGGGINLLGVVLNKVRREDSSSYFHYHRSYEGVGMPRLAGGSKTIRDSSKGA